ncbi:hypothetical protein FRC19_002834 [Serendipita sp. 401]|nr:hypothetical protein FRC19_002834 [Serendipita sp. 401]
MQLLVALIAVCTLLQPMVVLSRPMVQILDTRAVTSLNQAATAQAHQRDNTATRAVTSVQIKTSDGLCLFVDPLSGDFRSNLTPVQTVACNNNSPNQKWDLITSGKHNNERGFALLVSSLTNACLDFDDRRPAGNQVFLFSCGGRADGDGQTRDSQLFAFTSGNTIKLSPKRTKSAVCIVRNAQTKLLDQKTCNGSATEVFTIGNGGANAAVTTSASATRSTQNAQGVTSTKTVTFRTTVTQIVTVTRNGNAPAAAAATTTTTRSTAANAATTSSTTPAPTQTPTKTTSSGNGVTSVSGARGILDPTAAAQSHRRDDTATRAFTAVTIKSSSNKCLTINQFAGDFRLNLIPITLETCDASNPGQKWDVITNGKHITNQPGFALIVSSLTNGCLNFDPRRAAGDQVLIFSCGGRADGDGATADSQLFPFPANTPTNRPASLPLAPQNGKKAICFAADSTGAKLGAEACNAATPNAGETFIIG